MICPYGKIREIGTTADIGLEIKSGSLPLLFSAAAWGMSNLITDLSGVSGEHTRIIDLCAEDIEMLMIDWLNELLYLFATRSLLFSTYDIAMTGNRMHAELEGNVTDRQQCSYLHELKGVTWHGFSIKKKRALYHARILFDI